MAIDAKKKTDVLSKQKWIKVQKIIGQTIITTEVILESYWGILVFETKSEFCKFQGRYEFDVDTKQL